MGVWESSPLWNSQRSGIQKLDEDRQARLFDSIASNGFQRRGNGICKFKRAYCTDATGRYWFFWTKTYNKAPIDIWGPSEFCYRCVDVAESQGVCCCDCPFREWGAAILDDPGSGWGTPFAFRGQFGGGVHYNIKRIWYWKKGEEISRQMWGAVTDYN